MAINLSKGQNISLDKEAPGMTQLHVGLGWDVQQSTGASFDLDVVVFLTGEDGKALSDKHFVFFNNLTSPDSAVVHQGDNLTGEGEGDDEVVHIQLPQVDSAVQKVVFAVSIHEADTNNQNFGQVRNAFIRVVDRSNDQEFLKYELDEDFSTSTAIVVAEVYRRGAEWKFRALGEGHTGGLQKLLQVHGLA